MVIKFVNAFIKYKYNKKNIKWFMGVLLSFSQRVIKISIKKIRKKSKEIKGNDNKMFKHALNNKKKKTKLFQKRWDEIMSNKLNKNNKAILFNNRTRNVLTFACVFFLFF